LPGSQKGKVEKLKDTVTTRIDQIHFMIVPGHCHEAALFSDTMTFFDTDTAKLYLLEKVKTKIISKKLILSVCGGGKDLPMSPENFIEKIFI
jgi:hypothetical protein